MSDSQQPRPDRDLHTGVGASRRHVPGPAYFDAVFNRSANAMVVISLAGELLYANEAFLRLAGYSTEELFKLTFRELVHPEDQPLYGTLVGELSEDAPVFEIIHSLVCRDGRIIRVRNALALIQEGEACTILSTIEEITGRQAGREDEQRMRFLADNSPDFISLSEPEGTIFYLNKAGRDMLGIAPGAAGPHSNNEHLPPAELTRMREHILPHIRQHGHWEGRLTMRHEATGEEIPVQMKLMEIADPGSGKPLGLAGIGHDLRAELAARERMAEREERLQSAVELARLGTWNIDLASGYISYSDRVRELYGLPESPVLLSEMRGVHPDDAAGVAADMERALRRGGEGIYDSEHRALNEGTGEIRYLHSQGRVLYDAAGRPRAIVGTVQDITEQKLARQDLERQVAAHTEELYRANQQLQDLNSYLQQSNAELEQYAYVASHDLQEPLRKISVFAGMLSRMTELPPEAAATAGKISTASARMIQLIRDLLDFSRLLNGEHVMRPVDLNKVVADVLADFDLKIAERQAVVEVERLPTIEAVGLQMNQLFYNLIGNALKFVQEDVLPRIHIRCRKLDEGEHAVHGLHDAEIAYYFITVSDNGIGFNNLYAEQIFEVFKRLHTRHAYPGSGIGLALCRRILQNHGGIMTAQSEEGLGTTISMILPSRQVREPWQQGH